jgi:photosystem II stability/assembly factor-like uncharacterized protein
MFAHLDDQSPLEVGADQRDRVLRRAGALARRRRIAVITACVLVGGLIVGIVGSQTGGSHLRSQETAFQFDAEKGPLPIGTPVPTTSLVTVIFANAADGYALASHRSQAILAVTSDGGSTWSVQNRKLPPGYSAEGFPGQMEFVGTHGYLWGGTQGSHGAAPLWVSDNAGRTWNAAPIGPVIFDVSAIGNNVWAVAGVCGSPSILTCPVTLEESTDSGTTWFTPAGSPFSNQTRTPGNTLPIELARISLLHAYVLATGLPDSLGPAVRLLYTADGGLTWQPRPIPCTAAFALGAEVAASSTDDLWLLCGSQGSGGSQSKDLYRSEDGGLTWVLTASATGVGTSAPPAGQANTLPLGGYVAPFSIGHRNLAIASSTTAWLKPFGAPLFTTTDGGHTWGAVPDLAGTDVSQSGLGNITFISPTQGWICAYGFGLWHTSNGVTWTQLGV